MNRILSSVVVALISVASALIVNTDAFAQDRLTQRNDTSLDAGPRAVPARSSKPIEEDIEKLKAVVADQQKRIEQLEQMVGDQRKLIERAVPDSAFTTRDRKQTEPAVNARTADTADIPARQPPPPGSIYKAPADEESPLSIRIGKV